MSGSRLGLDGAESAAAGLTGAGPYSAEGAACAPLRAAAGLILGSPGPVGVVLVVYGVPAPQGSKVGYRALRKDGTLGRVAMREASPRVATWREDVKAAAMRALAPGTAPLDGPLAASMVFTLARPLGHFGTGRNAAALRASAPAWPAGTPDLIKLARATEDSLTAAGLIRDDARIVTYDALAKSYPGGHPDALSLPGAYIKIRQL